MPRGYRCIILAAFGWLTLANSQPQSAARDTEKQADSKVAEAAPAPAPRPSIKPVDSPKYKPPCRQPQDHDPCDLEAQWKAADAARDAANWGWWQMVFSAFGLAGLLYSLILTRRATKVAVDATEDADTALAIAERNASAATKHVEVAEDTARRQLRAYVGIKLGQIEDRFGDDPRAVIVFENYGQTPARTVKGRYRAQAAQLHEFVEPDITHHAGILNPAQQQAIVMGFGHVRQQHGQALAVGFYELIFDGVLTYTDIYGVTYEARFRAGPSKRLYPNAGIEPLQMMVHLEAETIVRE